MATKSKTTTRAVKPPRAKKIDGRSKADFIAFLSDTLIPDLRASGYDATADDFDTCIKWLTEG